MSVQRSKKTAPSSKKASNKNSTCRIAIAVSAPINTMIRMLERETASGSRCVADHRKFLELLNEVKHSLC